MAFDKAHNQLFVRNGNLHKRLEVEEKLFPLPSVFMVAIGFLDIIN